MRLPRRTLIAVILISALLTAGCGELVTTLSELRTVQNVLAKKFGEEVSVNVSQNQGGTMLMVWFVNSKLNDQTPDAREKRSEEAAQVVKASYSRIQHVRELWIGFLRQSSRFVVFHHTQIVAMHGFDKNAQRLPGRNEDRAQPPTDIHVTPTYSESSDETDISVSGIQLEGQPGGLGVTVLPFFKLKGSVESGKKRAPKTVSLNFASYAEKPRFEQVTPISFITDGKEVLKTEGTFTGKDAQFCYLTIPYKAFRQIVSGKDLVIKLGDKKYSLTPSQLGAMHAMTEYVTE